MRWALFALLVCCGGDDDDDHVADAGGEGEGEGERDAGTDAGRDASAGEDASVDPSGDIVFDPPSGTFRGSVDVSLSTGIAGAEIRWTADQQVPTAGSSLFEGTPVHVAVTTELRAQAFVAGVATGRPGTAVYVARDVDVSIDLPIVLLDNYGDGPLSAEDRRFVPAAFMSFGLEGGTASLADEPEVASRAGIHVRGQSTAFFDKTPIRIELRDPLDEDADFAVLGMPAESDWALRAPYADKALIREPFLWDLGRDMGMPAPRWSFCELYLNTAARPLSADDYMGVYLIVETVKNSPNRLDLAQLGPEDVALPELAGAYIVKFEWLVDDADPELSCSGAPPCWDFLKVHDPDPLAAEQDDWASQYFSDFDDALHSGDYAAWIDARSFADQIIINELGREMDAYIRSQFFYKDREGALFAGPLWDYNLTFGVGGFFENDQTAGWQVEQQRQPIAHDWFLELLADPSFEAILVARWQELRGDLLSDDEIDARIDALAAPLAAGAARNFERWPNLSERQVGFFFTPTDDTWEGQVEFMRDWIHDRVAWLDEQWR